MAENDGAGAEREVAAFSPLTLRLHALVESAVRPLRTFCPTASRYVTAPIH